MAVYYDWEKKNNKKKKKIPIAEQRRACLLFFIIIHIIRFKHHRMHKPCTQNSSRQWDHRETIFCFISFLFFFCRHLISTQHNDSLLSVVFFLNVALMRFSARGRNWTARRYDSQRVAIVEQGLMPKWRLNSFAICVQSISVTAGRDAWTEDWPITATPPNMENDKCNQ